MDHLDPLILIDLLDAIILIDILDPLILVDYLIILKKQLEYTSDVIETVIEMQKVNGLWDFNTDI